MDEIWVEVKKNYLLSNYGLLFKSVEGELMPVEPTELEDGSLQVELTVKMMRYRLDLAELVAKTFVPNPMEATRFEFIDGDKTNCRADNLRWLKPRERSGSYRRTGMMSNEDVLWCRENFIPRSRQFGASALARKFNRTPMSMYNLLSGVTYRDVGGPLHKPGEINGEPSSEPPADGA